MTLIIVGNPISKVLLIIVLAIACQFKLFNNSNKIIFSLGQIYDLSFMENTTEKHVTNLERGTVKEQCNRKRKPKEKKRFCESTLSFIVQS